MRPHQAVIRAQNSVHTHTHLGRAVGEHGDARVDRVGHDHPECLMAPLRAARSPCAVKVITLILSSSVCGFICAHPLAILGARGELLMGGRACVRQAGDGRSITHVRHIPASIDKVVQRGLCKRIDVTGAAIGVLIACTLLSRSLWRCLCCTCACCWLLLLLSLLCGRGNNQH